MTNHKILLVDDDRDVLEMLLSIFQRAGYTNLRTAASGAEALRIWQEEQPSLIVLDVAADQPIFQKLSEGKQAPVHGKGRQHGVEPDIDFILPP